MLKLFSFLGAFFMSFKALANPACPVCVVTVGAGLYVAEKAGLDKCVVGVFSGALLSIFGYFCIRYFNKKNWHFAGRDKILMLASIASIGFTYMGQLAYDPIIIGFLYIDGFLLSNILGAITFILGMHLYDWMKKRNNNKAHFPFEKVVVPFMCVGLLAGVFYYYPLCDCQKPTTDITSDDLIPVLE